MANFLHKGSQGHSYDGQGLPGDRAGRTPGGKVSCNYLGVSGHGRRDGSASGAISSGSPLLWGPREAGNPGQRDGTHLFHFHLCYSLQEERMLVSWWVGCSFMCDVMRGFSGTPTCRQCHAFAKLHWYRNRNYQTRHKQHHTEKIRL